MGIFRGGGKHAKVEKKPVESTGTTRSLFGKRKPLDEAPPAPPPVVDPAEAAAYQSLDTPEEDHRHPAMNETRNPDHQMSYITEAIGAFFLLFVGMTVGSFTTSLCYTGLVSMAAHISFAHFNPAITIAHTLRGALPVVDCFWYIAYQIAGATAAGLVFNAFVDMPDAPPDRSLLDAAQFGASLLGPTFALCLVHLAVLGGESRTQFFGLAVGFALFASIISFGRGSNLFNPAVGIGNWLARGLLGGGFDGIFTELALVVSSGIAAALAALVFNVCSFGGKVEMIATEAVGTFLAVALVITTSDSKAGTMAQAVGLGYGALTFFGAEKSEAHYNPAVTLAHFLKDTMDPAEAGAYVGAQLVAAIAATFVCGFFYGLPDAPTDMLSYSAIFGVLAGAFMLCLVHLHVFAAQQRNGFFGIAIGFTLLADIVVFSGPFNPAVSIGLWLADGVIGAGFDFGAAALLKLLVVVVVPLVGAGLAALAFNGCSLSGIHGKLVTEMIGTAFIVIALISTSESDGSESFGVAPTVAGGAAISRRELLLSWWEVGEDKGVSVGRQAGAAGLDDGLLYVAITYMAKYISAAHLNPAVSMAYVITGTMPVSDCGMYVGAQTVAALLAGLAGGSLYGLPSLGPADPLDIGFLVGLFLFASALILAHLTVIGHQKGNGFFGIAVGFILFAGVLAFGDSETAIFNPACAVGLYFANALLSFSAAPLLSDLVAVAVLVAVPLLGSLCAVALFKLMSREGDVGKLTTEAIGTFLVVLTLTMASGSVGLVYVSVTFMGAWASGAHYNPAISLVHFLLGDITQAELLTYSAAQTVGATLAGLIAYLEGNANIPAVDDTATPILILTAEVLFAFVLCIVHGNVLTSKGVRSGREGNGYFGLAMGFVYLGGFLTVSGTSGGVFNPAVGVGLWIAGAITTGEFSLTAVTYWVVGPILGAALARPVITYQKTADSKTLSA